MSVPGQPSMWQQFFSPLPKTELAFHNVVSTPKHLHNDHGNPSAKISCSLLCLFVEISPGSEHRCLDFYFSAGIWRPRLHQEKLLQSYPRVQDIKPNWHLRTSSFLSITDWIQSAKRHTWWTTHQHVTSCTAQDLISRCVPCCARTKSHLVASNRHVPIPYGACALIYSPHKAYRQFFCCKNRIFS